MHIIQFRQIFVKGGEVKGEMSQRRVAGLDAPSQALLEADWTH